MAVRFDCQSEPIAGYRLLDRLGSGGFGEVWRCVAPGGICKAVKVIHGDLRNRDNDTYRFAEQELKALHRVKSVRHPYLLALDRFDIVDGRLMIVMELADCNLWDRFRHYRKQGQPGIPRDELLRYMAETAEVLDLFNDKFGLQHLDIKPQNLFLLYEHVKVADFGQVKDLEGIMAQVTGGITPVYAAPETFDGFVSRYCDQYSLACVYQELLTGVRPFDGSSMQQLLLQHMQMPPNLAPSPPADRAALSRALAKKAEDRFPSVSAMVAALRTGEDESYTPPKSMTARAIAALAGIDVPVKPSSVIRLPATPELVLPGGRPTGSGVISAAETTPTPRAVTDTSPPRRPAPPEEVGPGTLRPTLLIGLGYTGLRVLQRFRKQTGDRYGAPTKTPLVRTLYVDTDPDAMAAAGSDVPAAGLVGLPTEDVFPAKLNRPAHYLKPRLNGRTLVEGWFDSQLLYRLPRTPVTMGYRVFGRLAFCDHYRAFAQRVQIELDACLDPQVLADTQAETGLAPRTNRPRVYVIAGLGGGTGSGMFLDLAYAVRHQLKALGYSNPDVVGVLLLPPETAAADANPLAQANAYAALTELYHFSHERTTYHGNHDDWDGSFRDSGAPFSQVVLLPGLPYPPPVAAATPPAPNARSSGSVTVGPRGTGSTRVPAERRSGTFTTEATRRPLDIDAPGRDPSATAAEFLRLDVFTSVGRALDERRPLPLPGSVRAVGLTRFAWPRAEIVARAARVIAPVLMDHWISPDPDRVRRVIPNWTTELWARIGLEPEQLTARLVEAADQNAGESVRDRLAASIDALLPKGWLNRLPDPDRVAAALTQWQNQLGRTQGAVLRPLLPIEEALMVASDEAVRVARTEFRKLFPGLIETPAFRLAGTEEALQQLLATVDRTRMKLEQQVADHEASAVASFDQLVTHTNYQKGIRKLTVAEFTEAIRAFPMSRYQILVKQAAIAVYRACREMLNDRLSKIVACRARIETCAPILATAAEVPIPRVAADLLPAGCASAEIAAKKYLKSLTDDDLAELDSRVQAGIERAFGGVYQACLNTTDGPDGILRVLREVTRTYLDARLGEVDVAAMLAQHLGAGSAALNSFRIAYDRAAPLVVGGGPWAQVGLGVVAAPEGAGGDPVRSLAAEVVPPGTALATVPDEVVIVREYPEVPLAAFPQLGPAWVAAYRSVPDAHQIGPHTRTDVTQWVEVDGA